MKSLNINRELWTPTRIIALILLILTYIVLHGRYMAEYIDDAWTLSWAYGFWEKGDVFDGVFGYIDGDGGTSLFSRTYVFVYGAFSKVFGWTRGGAFLLSTLFLGAAATCWYVSLRTLKYEKSTALDFILIFLLLDPFFSIANRARVDALGLFFLSLTILLFLRKRYLFSGFLMMVAFETHPLGGTAFFYILAYLFTIRKEMKDDSRTYLKGALWFSLGVVLGIAYYLLLHAPWLFNLTNLESRAGGNAFVSYFFLKRYAWRHWPELILVLISLTIFFLKKMYKKDKIIIPWIMAILLASLVLARANHHYVVYFFPPLILLIVVVFKQIQWQRLLLIGFLLFQLPQYAYLFRENRKYNHQEYLTKIQQTHEEVASDVKIIYGNPNAWFAFKELPFRAYGYFNRAKLEPENWPDEFLLIKNENFQRYYGEADLNRDQQQLYDQSLLKSIDDFNGSSIDFILYRKK